MVMNSHLQNKETDQRWEKRNVCHRLVQVLALEDPEAHRNFFRLSKEREESEHLPPPFCSHLRPFGVTDRNQSSLLRVVKQTRNVWRICCKKKDRLLTFCNTRLQLAGHFFVARQVLCWG